MFLAIDKPIGMTSFDVIRCLRRLLNKKKIGHTGTLDPMASGILLLAFESSCALIPLLSQDTKEYVFVAKWGLKTDTADSTGRTLKEINFVPTKRAINQILDNFRGGYRQIPPIYSAVHINGTRSYVLARKGQFPALTARFVNIDYLEVSKHIGEETIFHITCGPGTYIRSLVEDIADRLGGVATLVNLRRVRVGSFRLQNTVTLDSLERAPYAAQYFMPKQVLSKRLVLQVDKSMAQRFSYGQRVPYHMVHAMSSDGKYAAFLQDKLVALVDLKQGVLYPSSVFVLPGGVE